MVWRWWLWLGFLALWTAALVMPAPDPDELPLGDLIVSQRYLFAKIAHVAGYALLAAGTAWLPAARSWRWWLLGFLCLHGAATEWVQSHLAYRDGNLRDVMFDCLGVALGWLLTGRGRTS
jgi:VanZ family protein